MPKARYLLALLLVLFGLAACNAVQNASTESSSTDGGSGTPATPTEESAPLYIVLESKYENASDNSYIREGECAVASTASTPATQNISCSISIPELRLHYSKLKFTVGTSSVSLCPFVNFTPFYYVKATTNLTLQGNYEAYDCSSSKWMTDPFCWGGAAQSIIPASGFEFPFVRSLYYIPTSEAKATTYEMESSNKMSIANAKAVTAGTISLDAAFSQNAYVSNALPSGSRAASLATSFVDYAGSGLYQDYRWQCRDIYGEATYSITLTISDMDTETAEGVSNNFYDWN